MKVLVIGSGGREHALCWQLKRSGQVSRLWCAPGNPGMAREAELVPIAVSDRDGLRAFARQEQVELTVVGPEAPLVAGIVDEFEADGLRIFGPNRKAAQLEGSKAFAKGFMERHGLPTARAGTFRELDGARRFSEQLGYPQVIKASGLAAGKGAIIVGDRPGAIRTLEDMMERLIFGAAGDEVVIEEFMEGEEASFHMVVGDGRYAVLPSSQDHKRIGDGDTGPNTGGMGAYAPAPVLSGAALDRVRQEIADRVMAGLAADGIVYRGILYVGLMMAEGAGRIVEFNCRLGDPETQVLLPLLGEDWLDWMVAASRGSAGGALAWREGAAACVVMAAPGYPGEYPTGAPIRGLDAAEEAGALVFQAGTKRAGVDVVTAGGRVLGVVGTGPTLRAAVDQAYQGVACVSFEGMQFRRDIAARALLR